jgi:hypothetical protein
VGAGPGEGGRGAAPGAAPRPQLGACGGSRSDGGWGAAHIAASRARCGCLHRARHETLHVRAIAAVCRHGPARAAAGGLLPARRAAQLGSAPPAASGKRAPRVPHLDGRVAVAEVRGDAGDVGDIIKG